MPRKAPANRRPSQIIEFEVFRRGSLSTTSYTASIGYYDTKGEICELFLHSGKVGSDHQIANLELATITSLAIQYGVPLDTLRRSLPRDDEGKAEGAMGTLLDLIQETDIADLNKELLS
jgi:hypothetical protein